MVICKTEEVIMKKFALTLAAFALMTGAVAAETPQWVGDWLDGVTQVEDLNRGPGNVIGVPQDIIQLMMQARRLELIHDVDIPKWFVANWLSEVTDPAQLNRGPGYMPNVPSAVILALMDTRRLQITRVHA